MATSLIDLIKLLREAASKLDQNTSLPHKLRTAAYDCATAELTIPMIGQTEDEADNEATTRSYKGEIAIDRLGGEDDMPIDEGGNGMAIDLEALAKFKKSETQ